jgi:hypothetical protein
MELGQFAIIKSLLTEIRDLLKEQQPAQTKGLLLDSVQKFSSHIDENKCSCGNLPHELCTRPDCIRQIGIKNNLL